MFLIPRPNDAGASAFLGSSCAAACSDGSCCFHPRQNSRERERERDGILYPLIFRNSWTKDQVAIEIDLLLMFTRQRESRQGISLRSVVRVLLSWQKQAAVSRHWFPWFCFMMVGFRLTRKELSVGVSLPALFLTHFFMSFAFVCGCLCVCCASRHQNGRRWNLLVAMTHSLPLRPNSPPISGLVLVYTPTDGLVPCTVWDIGLFSSYSLATFVTVVVIVVVVVLLLLRLFTDYTTLF